MNKTTLSTNTTLKLKSALQAARNALEITETVDNALPNEGLDVASDFLYTILDEISEVLDEDWQTAQWIQRSPYKSILEAASVLNMGKKRNS